MGDYFITSRLPFIFNPQLFSQKMHPKEILADRSLMIFKFLNSYKKDMRINVSTKRDAVLFIHEEAKFLLTENTTESQFENIFLEIKMIVLN
jgi:hypothetical protein